MFSHCLPDDLGPAGKESAYSVCTLESEPLEQLFEGSIDGPGLGISPVRGIETHLAPRVTATRPPSAMA